MVVVQSAPDPTTGTDTGLDTAFDLAIDLHVERVLADYLAQRRAELPELASRFASAVDTLTDFALRGGKRLRPTFAWWGWRAAGGDAAGPRAASALRAVSALELIQACALVHDDLMDASDTRRGSPTVHVRFTDVHRTNGWLGAPDRFGTAAAILLGDLALAWADDLFVSVVAESGSGTTLPLAAWRAARQPWQRMRAEMFAGQYLDVVAQAEGDESESRPLEVARLKTAAYTVERPLHLGVALAGGDEPTVRAVRAFGADIGVAFQLRDDLLGMYGDTSVTGKPAGDDLREGKRTLLIAQGMRRADQAGRHTDADLLRGALGDTELTIETVDRVRAVLHEVGAVADVERRIESLTQSALTTLAAARLAEPAATRLGELAVAATRRDR